jgi:Bacterial regulatory helix-turn-helix protein, lysR family
VALCPALPEDLSDLHPGLLRCFVAVAEELHFSLAAHQLFIPQPWLPRTIRQLERQAGAPPFLRTRSVMSCCDLTRRWWRSAVAGLIRPTRSICAGHASQSRREPAFRASRSGWPPSSKTESGVLSRPCAQLSGRELKSAAFERAGELAFLTFESAVFHDERYARVAAPARYIKAALTAVLSRMNPNDCAQRSSAASAS